MILDVHKLLRNCFGQAVKWELLGLTWDCVDISEEQKASDMDTLMRLLSNPETAGLLKQLVKAIDK